MDLVFLIPIMIFLNTAPISVGGYALAQLRLQKLGPGVSASVIWCAIVAISAGFWTYAAQIYGLEDSNGQSTDTAAMLFLAIVINFWGTYFFYRFVYNQLKLITAEAKQKKHRDVPASKLTK